MNKKVISIICVLLISVIITSCSLFGSKKETKPETSSRASENSSQTQRSETKEQSSELQQSQQNQELKQEVENWKDELIGLAEDVNITSGISDDVKQDLGEHILKAKEYLDHNNDNKLQFAFFSSKKGITSSIAVSAIEKVASSNDMLDYLGDCYSTDDLLNKFGESVEVIFVANSSDEALINEFLSQKGLQSNERYIMVMDASQLVNML